MFQLKIRTSLAFCSNVDLISEAADQVHWQSTYKAICQSIAEKQLLLFFNLDVAITIAVQEILCQKVNILILEGSTMPY